MGRRSGLSAVGRSDERVVVWKFGGTSVGDTDRIRAVARRMVDAQRAGQRVVAVLSAMGKSTDQLSARAHELSGRPPLRELDALLAVGESVSVALTAMAVYELGSRAVSLTGAQAGMVTDGVYGNARLRAVRPARIEAALDDGAIVLVTGFQGVSDAGDVTTMGRGGSDASAVAVAAGLGLAECDIYTDVDGVYTADPRIVPEARRLARLTHDEMLELAEAGAGVLQPRAVALAAAHGVDIHLRSSFTAEPGTWVARAGVAGGGAVGEGEFERATVTGVAHRRVEPLFTARGVAAAEVLAALAARGIAVGVVRIGDIADVELSTVEHADGERAGVDNAAVDPASVEISDVELVNGERAGGELSDGEPAGGEHADGHQRRGGGRAASNLAGRREIEFSAPGAEVAEVEAVLAGLGAEAVAEADLGTVSLVSPGINRAPRLTAGVLAELDAAGIPARFVATTPARVSVHVASGQVDAAVRALHRRFVASAAVEPAGGSVAVTAAQVVTGAGVRAAGRSEPLSATAG